MSPQFVDFDADGRLDVVAGIFDGSPHLSRGSDQGWLAPEQILDKDGARIVMNAFWNFDTKKWDSTTRCDPDGLEGEGHLTSAVAFDQDGDGDFDLLLGDHSTGRVFLRRNEGSNAKPAFATRNELVLAGGKPIDVPGTVATLRLVDWNGDGRLDLLASGMADGQGGVHVFLNTGKAEQAAYGPMLTLVAPGKKVSDAPVRPDSGLYADAGDVDGDGDLDLVVGGYSHWEPKPRELTAEQEQRVAELRKAIAEQQQKLRVLSDAAEKAVEGLGEEAMEKKYDEVLKSQQAERGAIMNVLLPLQEELGQLVPGRKRESFVWFYENLTKAAAKPAPAK
ncbi:MAG: hypothetical protein FJ265_14280 [Planctomycetes bacterium]|nr:hypothetical protein [Planctomycetota bacterium]